MTTRREPLPYRTLDTIARTFRLFGWIGYAMAALYAMAISKALGSTENNAMGFAIAIVPAMGVALVSMVLHAFGEAIMLAIDCADHLATIESNTAPAIVLEHPGVSDDLSTDAPAADSSAEPETP